MRRRLITVVVCLLLGAIVNVAVAWGCVLWWPHEPAVLSWLGEERVVLVSSRSLNVLSVIHQAVGWPARSLSWHAGDSGSYLLIGSDQRCLPVNPIGPGFAINTVFYACILWLLFAGPFVVRRWRRIRHGLCPKCAYDLRGSDSGACPECGAAVIKTA